MSSVSRPVTTGMFNGGIHSLLHWRDIWNTPGDASGRPIYSERSCLQMPREQIIGPGASGSHLCSRPHSPRIHWKSAIEPFQ